MDFVQLTRENERLHAINLQEGSQMPANSQLIASEEVSRLRTSPSTENISNNPPIGNANEALCMLIESQEVRVHLILLRNFFDFLTKTHRRKL